jgi:aminopeptidase N
VVRLTAVVSRIGAATSRGGYVPRSRITDADYECRSETILHEMANTRFGDPDTIQCCNGLWLNEPFATYASVLCQTSATRWIGPWTAFADVEKTWGQRQDQLPSTHPVATDAPDVQRAEVSFDGITCVKGAGVLKQLGVYVGVEAFLADLRHYFAEHAYATSPLADLLRALEKSSPRDLGQWSSGRPGNTGPSMNAARAGPSRAAGACALPTSRSSWPPTTRNWSSKHR